MPSNPSLTREEPQFMLTTLLSAAWAMSAAPEFAKPVAVDAALFKNGYAMVTYQIPVPSNGDLWIKDPPQGTLGTLWFFTDKGGKISNIVMTKVEDEKANVVTAQNFVDLLTMNKGKTVTVTVLRPKGESEDIVAKIVEVTPQLFVIESKERKEALNVGSVVSVKAGDIVYSKSSKTKVETPALHIKSTGTKNLYMYALQSGLTWVPSYNVDISDKDKLVLTAKSTVVNDLVDLNLKEARFVSGFPNIQYLGQPDPLTFYQKVQEAIQRGQMGGSGGFGGGMANQKAFAAPSAAADFANSFSSNDLSGFQAEDLYFYKQPDVLLKKGDRALYMVFASESPYKHVYTLDVGYNQTPDERFVPVPNPTNDVMHQLKFKNLSGRPLTTAPATIMQNGQLLAQSTTTYTPINAELLLPLTKSLDISNKIKEEETGIETEAVKATNYNPAYDRVTMKGTIELTNYKTTAVDMDITKVVRGDLIDASNGGVGTKLARTADGSGSTLNANTQIKWSVNLKPDEKLTITYTYTSLIRSRGR